VDDTLDFRRRPTLPRSPAWDPERADGRPPKALVDHRLPSPFRIALRVVAEVWRTAHVFPSRAHQQYRFRNWQYLRGSLTTVYPRPSGGVI
jgi:hypothetical protein